MFGTFTSYDLLLSLTLHCRSSSTPLSSLQNKSPTRRPKSRWEPLVESKPFVKPASTFTSGVKFGGWNHPNVNNKKVNIISLLFARHSLNGSDKKNICRALRLFKRWTLSLAPSPLTLRKILRKRVSSGL